MNRYSVFFLMMCCAVTVYAQDVITLKNGDEIKAKVTEITSSEIKYKRYDNLDGPTVVAAKQDVFAINYENGTREVINAASTSSAPAARTATQSTVMDNKMNFGVYANAGGLFTHGPMIGAELTKGKIIGDFGLHLNKFGTLSYTSAHQESMDSGIGLFVGIKFFNPKPKGGFYAGFIFDYWTHKYSNDSGWKSDSQGIAVMANVGYKFFLSSNLYLRTGGYVGTGFETNCVDTYDNGSWTDTDSGSTNPAFMLDLSIGIKF